MIPREWLKNIRRIELRTSRLVEDLLAGQYHSVFKGRGMDFDEVRPYAAGDDVRRIDWNVTARTGLTHIKKYVEEREMTVLLMVDASASKNVGSHGPSKRELAAELAALIGFAASRNNDNVGLLLFTEGAERYIPPGKGRSHILRIIGEVLSHEPAKRQTDVGAALGHVGHALRRRAIVFVLSDFLDAQLRDRPLRILRQRHDVIAIPVIDAGERDLPDVGTIVFEDAETGELVEVDSADLDNRESYSKASWTRLEEMRLIFRRSGVDAIEVHTDRPYLKPLLQFFDTRIRRRNR
jgi:uncharacterized protein (DUF58 family)